MKILKGIIRTILIIITSILITAFVFTIPITKIVFNQKEVIKIIDNSDIYEKIDKDVKESIVESLNEALTEVPEDVREEIDTKELVNSIDTQYLLKGLTDGIIDIVYSVSQEELTLKDIVNKYNDEFDKYIKDNNIEIDDEDLNEIHKALSDESLNEILDDDEINETLKEVKEAVDEIKESANLTEAIIIIIILVLTGIILLLSNNKVNSIITLR